MVRAGMPSGDEPSRPIGAAHPLLVEIQRNLDREIDLGSLARAFGYSPFHFHRLFVGGLGETPKGHIDRLRLEKAWLLVAVTDESILDIALAVGFASHETFCRAFKRCYGQTPTAFRRAAKAAQRERLERNRDFRGEGCQLSDVRFVTLRPKPLLALRRVQAYAELDLAPFTERDPYWTALAAWAAARGIAHERRAIGIYYDIPGQTPEHAQRSDFCIPLEWEVEDAGPYSCIAFAGGEAAVIEHRGSRETIDQAYRNVADAIRRSSDRYAFADAPPFQVFLSTDLDDPSLNRTEVCFRVTRAR
jgi:AraC family transcriptional regulator